MEITAYQLASRYVGVAEIAGTKNHPLVQWWLSLCHLSLETADETPWCSAFANGIAWELRLVRSYSAAARSWLTVGTPLELRDAAPAWDVVVFNRGGSGDPHELSGPGHVGFFAGVDETTGKVLVLAGNQGDRVCIAALARADLLGVRHLMPA